MTPSLINKTWLASALHYYTLANEYYTLLNSVDAVNNGGISADEFLTVLDELIFCREDLMKVAESARKRILAAYQAMIFLAFLEATTYTTPFHSRSQSRS